MTGRFRLWERLVLVLGIGISVTILFQMTVLPQFEKLRAERAAEQTFQVQGYVSSITVRSDKSVSIRLDGGHRWHWLVDGEAGLVPGVHLGAPVSLSCVPEGCTATPIPAQVR